MGSGIKIEAYDIVLDIDCIVGAQKGWSLTASKTIENFLLNCTSQDEAEKLLKLDEHCAIVGVFGLFNRGKTHLLNKLTDVKLPSDKKIHTKGLSFKRPVDQMLNIILLDTAGTNSPVDKVFSKTTKDPIAEKKTTELLIQETAFSIVDTVIIVVNEITWPDQEFLQIVQQKLRSSTKQEKRLFVVHNYYDIESEKDLLMMWRSCVLSTMEGKSLQEKIDNNDYGIYFKQDCNNNEAPTLHFFIGREGSEAGKIFNHRTYKLLQKFALTNVVPNKIPIKQLLSTALLESLKLYTKKPEKIDWTWNKEWRIPEPQLPLEPKTVGGPFGKGLIALEEWLAEVHLPIADNIGHFSLQCKGDLSLTHVASFDGFRLQLVPNHYDFIPDYDVIKTENGLLIIVDLPGVDTEDKSEMSIPKIVHHDLGNLKTTHIVFCGKRDLFFPDFQRDQEGKYQKDPPLISLPLDKEETKIKMLKNHLENDKHRKGGAFEIPISIPPDVDDDLSKAKIVGSGGMYVVFLPNKVVKEESIKVETTTFKRKK